MDGGLKIGELARRAGVTAKAIRFYERRRVLPPAERAVNGYRVYGDDAVEMLRFVKRATGLGLTLTEIKDVIAIRQGGRPPCTHVHRLLQDKAVELDRKLKDLIEVRRRIRQSLRAWNKAPSRRAPVCPHIERRPVGAARANSVSAGRDGRRGAT
jgi:DNA-binding transcriptional MerR regulator